MKYVYLSLVLKKKQTLLYLLKKEVIAAEKFVQSYVNDKDELKTQAEQTESDELVLIDMNKEGMITKGRNSKPTNEKTKEKEGTNARKEKRKLNEKTSNNNQNAM